MEVLVGLGIIVGLGVCLINALAEDLEKAKRGEESTFWEEKQ
jgi:hypothetical protein